MHSCIGTEFSNKNLQMIGWSTFVLICIFDVGIVYSYDHEICSLTFASTLSRHSLQSFHNRWEFLLFSYMIVVSLLDAMCLILIGKLMG